MALGEIHYSGWFSMQNYEENFSAQGIYPTLADGALITTHADEFTLGNYAEIVPVNTITNDFHIHHIHIIAPVVNAVWECVLYQVTTEIGRFTFSSTDKKDDVEGIEINTSQCDANS